MSTSTQLMTADELLRLPRGRHRYELINGELKTRSLAEHNEGRVTVQVASEIAQFVWGNKLGEVYSAGTGFQLSFGPDTVLSSDIAYTSAERLKQVGGCEGYWPGAPDLAVEVLSSGETETEVALKVSQWFSFATRQVWIVDPKNEMVTVYRSVTDRVMFTAIETLEADDLLPGFRIVVKRLFE